ncbi:MAG: hypothetical protein IPO21_19920 [Bacteroidales bacterium]|nr:hypothetical protein [Bacteroidales bacterium]
MKKFYTCVIALIFSVGVFAQDIPNHEYLNFSWYRPTGYGLPDFRDAHSEDIRFARQFNNGFHFGGSFAIGSNFYINKMNWVDGLRMGINAEYIEFSANYLKGEYQYIVSDEKFHDVHGKISPKVGIVISYMPLKIMKMDLFVRWAPAFGVWYMYDEEHSYNFYGYEKLENTAFEYALNRFSFGFNYRISVIRIGVEYINGVSKSSIEYDGFTKSPRNFKDDVFKLNFGFNFE